MTLKQLPFLASALAMTAGLYVLAGPFRSDRSAPGDVAGLWGVLLVYEFLVIGALGFLRRRELDTLGLRIVSIFFLADPVFLGDAFASMRLGLGLALNGIAWALSLLKAWALARACGVKVTPWPAGWVAAAFGFIYGIPSLIAWASTRPALFLQDVFFAATWAGAAVAVPLVRARGWGWAGAAALVAHAAASALVNDVAFESRFVMAPLVAAAALLPWPRWGWAPLAAAVLFSPLRAKLATFLSSESGIGAALIGAAFAFLGGGLLWNLRREAPSPAPRRERQSTPA